MSGFEGELRGTHVVVVDDDVDNREMLAMTLEHCGARVTRASSAAEALCALEKERPQVLISDIGLPAEQQSLQGVPVSLELETGIPTMPCDALALSFDLRVDQAAQAEPAVAAAP